MTFDQSYQAYYKALYQFAYQLTRSDSESKDLVQTVFLKYYEEKKEIRNTKSWLFKVLYNLFLTTISKNRNHRTILDSVSRMQTNIADAEEIYERNERERLVTEIITSLPNNESTLLLLYHDGLKYAEIAEVLNINPNSVGKLLARTIKKLVLKFKSEYHEMF